MADRSIGFALCSPNDSRWRFRRQGEIGRMNCTPRFDPGTRTAPVILACVAAAVAAGCMPSSQSQSVSKTSVYTLYRSSPLDAKMRVHVATFDVTFDGSDSESYNRENCETAQRLFQQQPGVESRFFCERGRFRP